MTDLMSVLHPATPPEPKGARIIRGCMGPPHDEVEETPELLARRKKKRESAIRSKQRKKERTATCPLPQES